MAPLQARRSKGGTYGKAKDFGELSRAAHLGRGRQDAAKRIPTERCNLGVPPVIFGAHGRDAHATLALSIRFSDK